MRSSCTRKEWSELCKSSACQRIFGNASCEGLVLAPPSLFDDRFFLFFMNLCSLLRVICLYIAGNDRGGCFRSSSFRLDPYCYEC